MLKNAFKGKPAEDKGDVRPRIEEAADAAPIARRTRRKIGINGSARDAFMQYAGSSMVRCYPRCHTFNASAGTAFRSAEEKPGEL